MTPEPLVENEKDTEYTEKAICPYCGRRIETKSEPVVQNETEAAKTAAELADYKRDAIRLRYCVLFGFPRESQLGWEVRLPTGYILKSDKYPGYATAVEVLDIALRKLRDFDY